MIFLCTMYDIIQIKQKNRHEFEDHLTINLEHAIIWSKLLSNNCMADCDELGFVQRKGFRQFDTSIDPLMDLIEMQISSSPNNLPGQGTWPKILQQFWPAHKFHKPHSLRIKWRTMDENCCTIFKFNSFSRIKCYVVYASHSLLKTSA